MLFFCMFVYTVPRSANQNLRLFTLLALSFEGSLEGPRSAPAIVAAGPTLPRHSPASVFHFPASLSPFRINTYEISCKCCKQRTYRIAKSFRFHTYKKHGGVGVLWLTNSLQALMGKKRIYAKPLSPCFLFAAHSSKFRIPQVLCLPARRGGPLLRKLPGASQQFPFWNSILSSALPPRSQRLRVILFRSSLLNFQLSTSVFPALHYPLHFGRTACRPARTPGNCSASTPLPRACASTCLPSKRVSAPTPAKPAPTKKPGASPRCCTISITSAGPTRSTPPTRGIPPKARRFCASRATPRKSSAPFFLTRITATFRANPRWSTRYSPATSSPASSPLAPTSARRKAFSISKWTP